MLPALDGESRCPTLQPQLEPPLSVPCLLILPAARRTPGLGTPLEVCGPCTENPEASKGPLPASPAPTLLCCPAGLEGEVGAAGSWKILPGRQQSSRRGRPQGPAALGVSPLCPWSPGAEEHAKGPRRSRARQKKAGQRRKPRPHLPISTRGFGGS